MILIRTRNLNYVFQSVILLTAKKKIIYHVQFTNSPVQLHIRAELLYYNIFCALVAFYSRPICCKLLIDCVFSDMDDFVMLKVIPARTLQICFEIAKVSTPAASY